MTKRKLGLIAGVTAIALILFGCSSSGSESPSEAAAAVDESICGTANGFCVGLVSDTGTVDDKSFNQSAWEGAKVAADAAGGFAKYIETADPKDYAGNIEQLATRKYNVIVTVGFLMAEATTAAARKYPGIKFIGVDQLQGDAVSNLAGLVFPEDKAGFLAGYLAGYLTQSGKVGAVLGTDVVPPVKRFGEGYRAGAAYAAREQGRPMAPAALVYHAPDNAFNDPAWGAMTADQLLAQGFDVIFGVGGKTGNGALGETASKEGAFCIGVDTDQWGTVPEAHPCLVTSAMKLIPQGVQTLIAKAKDGSMTGGNFAGDVGLAPYHDFAGKVPADVQDKVTALTPKVLSGEVPTGVNP